MCETYTAKQHQYLIDEAHRAAKDGDPTQTINKLMRSVFADADDKNREYIIDEFWIWFMAFQGIEEERKEDQKTCS